MFEAMLAAALQPVYDRLTELEEANERGGRRTRQAIQLGVVKKLVGTRVVIQIGKAHTPPIKWFSLWAGEAMTWRAPSEGEMALVLNYGSGDRNTSSIALVGVDSERYPFPVDDPNLVHQKLGNTGALLEWKLDEGNGKFHARILACLKGIHIRSRQSTDALCDTRKTVP